MSVYICIYMPQFAAVDSRPPAKSICVCIAIPHLRSSLRSTTLSRRDLGCKIYRWRRMRTRGGLLQVGNTTLASISPYSCTSCSFPFQTESSCCCDGDGEHGVDTSRGIATSIGANKCSYRRLTSEWLVVAALVAVYQRSIFASTGRDKRGS